MAEDGDEPEFVTLTHELAAEGLSKIELIVGGGGFAFTKLDCSGKDLTDIGNLGKGGHHAHLKHVVLSNNKLSNVKEVTRLSHLLTLRLDNNALESVDCLQDAELPWCQRIDASSNKLQKLPALGALGRLRFAHFGTNEVTSLEGFGDHPVIEELDLKENKLESLAGLGKLEKLRKLVLAGNQLKSLEGLDTPVLTHLEVKENQLTNLEHIAGAPECTMLDVGSNQIEAEAELQRLKREAKKLKELVLAGNPLADNFGDTCRTEVLVRLRQLKSIDGEDVTEEDSEAAKAREAEMIEEERQRKEEEQQELEAKEGDGDGDGE